MWKLNQFNYSKRVSNKIQIGNLQLGGDQPIRVQSMANTDTNNIENSVNQCLRIVQAGGEIVRFTTQGIREAENIGKIRAALRSQNCHVPLVADIHFNANASDVAARNVEKVRINPGNYIGSIKTDKSTDYTEEEFRVEFDKLKTRFIEFLNICKEYGTAIRIGVNHGSLSERMMNKYGDTSEGMVASCMELLNICQDENFDKIVISMKTSNTVMMVHTVRLLVSEMEKKKMYYPLHLGVTEAGDGEDGRIKSAVGIGALLADGIGDTIRVSLSEEPENEIPVAQLLVQYISKRAGHKLINETESNKVSKFNYCKRHTNTILNIGGNNLPIVIGTQAGSYQIKPDYIIKNSSILDSKGNIYPIYCKDNLNELRNDTREIKFITLSYIDTDKETINLLKQENQTVVLLKSNHLNPIGEMRAFFHLLLKEQCDVPVIICRNYSETILEKLQIKAAADCGVLFIDGLGDGLLLENSDAISTEAVNSVAFSILQASRVRITKTEFISCPGCGRTMFNLQEVITNIKARTSHLKGLKIGIMGCIVNGPGEMADADYGYVGAGRGKVSLYKKKECVEKNIPENEAVEKLIEIIKNNGDWVD